MSTPNSSKSHVDTMIPYVLMNIHNCYIAGLLFHQGKRGLWSFWSIPIRYRIQWNTINKWEVPSMGLPQCLDGLWWFPSDQNGWLGVPPFVETPWNPQMVMPIITPWLHVGLAPCSSRATPRSNGRPSWCTIKSSRFQTAWLFCGPVVPPSTSTTGGFQK